jgi:hypothetical protein
MAVTHHEPPLLCGVGVKATPVWGGCGHLFFGHPTIEWCPVACSQHRLFFFILLIINGKGIRVLSNHFCYFLKGKIDRKLKFKIFVISHLKLAKLKTGV